MPLASIKPSFHIKEALIFAGCLFSIVLFTVSKTSIWLYTRLSDFEISPQGQRPKCCDQLTSFAVLVLQRAYWYNRVNLGSALVSTACVDLSAQRLRISVAFVSASSNDVRKRKFSRAVKYEREPTVFLVVHRFRPAPCKYFKRASIAAS
jgi:hypothetical protein